MGIYWYLTRKLRKYPKPSDVIAWHQAYPGDPTPILTGLEAMMEGPMELGDVCVMYDYLLEHPACLVHYSQIRTASLEQIPRIMEFLQTLVHPSDIKKADDIRGVLEKYLQFVKYIQTVLLSTSSCF